MSEKGSPWLRASFSTFCAKLRSLRVARTKLEAIAARPIPLGLTPSETPSCGLRSENGRISGTKRGSTRSQSGPSYLQGGAWGIAARTFRSGWNGPEKRGGGRGEKGVRGNGGKRKREKKGREKGERRKVGERRGNMIKGDRSPEERRERGEGED